MAVVPAGTSITNTNSCRRSSTVVLAASIGQSGSTQLIWKLLRFEPESTSQSLAITITTNLFATKTSELLLYAARLHQQFS